MKKLSLVLLVLALVAALALPVIAHRKHRGGGGGGYGDCSGPCGDDQPRYEREYECDDERRGRRQHEYRDCDKGRGDDYRGRGGKNKGRKHRRPDFESMDPEAKKEMMAAKENFRKEMDRIKDKYKAPDASSDLEKPGGESTE